MRVLLVILGVVSTAVGVRWLQLFVFTEYRAQWRHVMIPLWFNVNVVGEDRTYSVTATLALMAVAERSSTGDDRLITSFEGVTGR